MSVTLDFDLTNRVAAVVYTQHRDAAHEGNQRRLTEQILYINSDVAVARGLQRTQHDHNVRSTAMQYLMRAFAGIVLDAFEQADHQPAGPSIADHDRSIDRCHLSPATQWLNSCIKLELTAPSTFLSDGAHCYKLNLMELYGLAVTTSSHLLLFEPRLIPDALNFDDERLRGIAHLRTM